MKLFLIALISLLIHAENRPEDRQFLLYDEDGNQKLVTEFSTTDTELENSLCLDETKPTKVQMQDWIKENVSERQMERLLKKLNVNSVEEFDEIGTHLLYMLARYNLNGSHFAYDNSSGWRVSELDEILVVLSDFPDQIFEDIDTHQITHYTRGQTKPGYGTPGGKCFAGDSTIHILDCWNHMSRLRRHHTIAHELGHVVLINSRRLRREWKKVIGYVRNEKKYDVDCTVSMYGTISYAEDFSETFVNYLYTPEKLNHCSKKYDLLKKVFHNKEFTCD